MTVLAFAAALAGWFCLALAMARHRRQLGRPPASAGLEAGLRLAGVLCLALSFWAAGRAWGWDAGAVAWFGILTVTAAGPVLVLAFRAART